MSQQKPLDPELTRKGTPRKNKPGAGRPAVGRQSSLPRITARAKAIVEAIAAERVCSHAEALEYALELAARHHKLSVNA